MNLLSVLLGLVRFGHFTTVHSSSARRDVVRFHVVVDSNTRINPFNISKNRLIFITLDLRSYMDFHDSYLRDFHVFIVVLPQPPQTDKG